MFFIFTYSAYTGKNLYYTGRTRRSINYSKYLSKRVIRYTLKEDAMLELLQLQEIMPYRVWDIGEDV